MSNPSDDLKWIIISDDPAAQEAMRRNDEVSLRLENEHTQLVDACVAAGGHDWWLELEVDDDDGGSTQLSCALCPASTDDLYPDGHDMIYFEHQDIRIEAGRHNSLEPMYIPVTATVRSWRDYWGEYDVEMEILPRLPGDGRTAP